MRYGEAGQSHLLPFLGAAALFAALTITAHSVVLGLAAVIAGPVPAAKRFTAESGSGMKCVNRSGKGLQPTPCHDK